MAGTQQDQAGQASAALTAEARAWVADCVWADLAPEDVAALTDAAVWRGVARHYDGGCEAFARDAG